MSKVDSIRAYVRNIYKDDDDIEVAADASVYWAEGGAWVEVLIFVRDDEVDLTGDRDEEPACRECGQAVSPDDLVWIGPDGEASTGDDASPYHVGCAPEQEKDLLLWDEHLIEVLTLLSAAEALGQTSLDTREWQAKHGE